jgi:hypothetical protein
MKKPETESHQKIAGALLAKSQTAIDFLGNMLRVTSALI